MVKADATAKRAAMQKDLIVVFRTTGGFCGPQSVGHRANSLVEIGGSQATLAPARNHTPIAFVSGLMAGDIRTCFSIPSYSRANRGRHFYVKFDIVTLRVSFSSYVAASNMLLYVIPY